MTMFITLVRLRVYNLTSFGTLCTWVTRSQHNITSNYVLHTKDDITTSVYYLLLVKEGFLQRASYHPGLFFHFIQYQLYNIQFVSP